MSPPKFFLYVAEGLFTKEWCRKTASLQQVQFAFPTRGEKCLCKNEVSSSSVMLCTLHRYNLNRNVLKILQTGNFDTL